MPVVTLDNETVEFSGSTPKHYEDVIKLISDLIEKNDLCFQSFIVDGCNIMEGNTPKKATFNKIEITTVPQSDMLLQYTQQFKENSVNLMNDLETFSINVLHYPWSKIKNNIEMFSEKISPIADLLQILQDYSNKKNPTWMSHLHICYTNFNSAISDFADQMDGDNITGLSDCVTEKIIPSVININQTLDEQILQFFERSTQS